MQPLKLSKADTNILTQVFDPESGPARAEVIVDPSLPADRHIISTELLSDLRAREKSAIKMIETFETSKSRDPKAKETTFRDALKILDEIVEECPEYASARNNRAQLRRWMFGDRNMLCRRRGSTDVVERNVGGVIVQDLKEAVALASPARPPDAVSPIQGRLLAQAYTQLGALYLHASKDLGDSHESAEDIVEVVDATFEGWTSERFEEEASRLFYLGGLYGNEVAKALAVHTNPHAKLCGNIVKEAMRKEIAEVS